MLGEALADGRISHDEYGERMSAALSARTLGELAQLTTDLAAPEHQPVQLDGGRRSRRCSATPSGAAGGWCRPP